MFENRIQHRFAHLLGLSVAASAVTVPAIAETYTAGDNVEEIVVSGRAQTLYRVSETSVARGAADPMDIPQAVTVLNAAMIADQGARDMTDLYRNVAGISIFSYSGVTFRGFRQDQVFYDNLRGNPFIAFSVPKLFNIERVEVLKGPAGMLYGPGEPGGLINYVTKLPTDELAASASLTGGNYDRYGAAGDVSGPLNKNGTILGRAGAFYESMKPFRNNTKDTSLILDGGLTFKLGENTQLITQVSHYDQDMGGARLRGVPVDDNGDFLADRSWNTNEKSDFLDLKATVLQARLQGEVSDGWSYELAARYFDANERQQYHEARGLVDTDGDGVVDASRRELRDQERTTKGLTLAASTVINKPLFGLDNTVLVGADYYKEDADFWAHTVPNGEIPLLSLQNPVYGLSGASFYDLESYPLRTTESSLKRTGIYLQDQLNLTDELILIAGVRYDDFEDRDDLGDTGFSDGDWALRGGVIYKPADGVSFYASWSESFEPQAISSQSDLAGGPFAPITGSQIEGGVKLDLFNGRVQAGAAVYQIKRQNLLQVDPNGDESDGVADFSSIGEVTSEGFEVELVADLTDAWVLTANYGYNDARITETVPGGTLTNAVGDRFANAPKHQAGLWTRYEVAEINTTFAAGMEYVGERISIEGQPVKAYTIFDASIIYKLSDNLDILLRADNIFDKKYAASGFIARTGHFPGDPRTVFAELRWKL